MPSECAPKLVSGHTPPPGKPNKVYEIKSYPPFRNERYQDLTDMYLLTIDVRLQLLIAVTLQLQVWPDGGSIYKQQKTQQSFNIYLDNRKHSACSIHMPTNQYTKGDKSNIFLQDNVTITAIESKFISDDFFD